MSSLDGTRGPATDYWVAIPNNSAASSTSRLARQHIGSHTFRARRRCNPARLPRMCYRYCSFSPPAVHTAGFSVPLPSARNSAGPNSSASWPGLTARLFQPGFTAPPSLTGSRARPGFTAPLPRPGLMARTLRPGLTAPPSQTGSCA